MSDHDTQFMLLYQRHRADNQRQWYESRQAEFESARDQGITLNVVLLALAAAASLFAAGNVFSLKLLWSVLAVVFPVLSTAISAYDALYAFERQAKIYADAANALHSARADAPDLRPDLVGPQYQAAVGNYVSTVENIVRKEQGQWGQLIDDIKLVDPPAAPAVQR